MKLFRKAVSLFMAITMTINMIPFAQAAAMSAPSQRELENAAFSRKAAAQGMVLLKDSGQVLPLQTEDTVAVFGRTQIDTIKGGTGSGNVNCKYVVNVLDGLKSANVKVNKELADTYTAWCKANPIDNGGGSMWGSGFHYNPEMPLTEEAVQKAAGTSSKAVVVIGRISGENSDLTAEKGNYFLTDDEQEMIDKVTANFNEVIVILNVGGVMDTSFINDKISAVVYMSQAGQEGGNAVADVLTGKVNPSGKLSTTWGETLEDYASSKNFGASEKDENGKTQVIYNDDIYVGYRYFDTFNITPKYEFGFGLSYTDFEINTDSVNVKDLNVEVKATVKNTGSVSGKEVVQIYYSAPDGKLEKPYQQLAAYAKTKELAPKESQQLTLRYKLTDMASFYTPTASFILEKGDYIVRVGNSSRNTKVGGVITIGDIGKRQAIEQVDNRLEPNKEINAISKDGVTPYSYAEETAEIAAAKQHAIIVDTSKISIKNSANTITDDPEEMVVAEADKGKTYTLVDVAEKKATLEQVVAQMSEDELGKFAGGHTAEDDDPGGAVVGNSAREVLGAAGESWACDKYKMPATVFADGPAGIRLTQAVDKDGDKVIDFEQNCTAFPIGTLLAMTWDVDLVREFGERVSAEMLEYNVDCWLAPGMNIHRNPLCGRNYEYYSEDPTLTGTIGASVTKGIQEDRNGNFKGTYVAIKHFAANNQETDRTKMTSVVSERALREIYLKGFEIAIKTAQPWSIMTAYNDLNGKPCAHSFDLCTAIARGEWGFNGLIMTDWGGCFSTVGAMSAGNDLIMPGWGTWSIVQAMRNGTITKAMVQRCVYNQLKVTMRTPAFAKMIGKPAPETQTATAHQTESFKFDGVLDESVWANLTPISKDIDTTTPATNKAAFGVSYDNENMYIALKSDDLTGTKENLKMDYMTFYVSPTNSRGDNLAKNDFQIQVNNSDADPTVKIIESGWKDGGQNNTIDTSKVEIKYNYTDKTSTANAGYTMEIKVPLSVATIVPVDGGKIGFDLMAFSKGGNDLVWAGDNNDWKSPKNYGEITFKASNKSLSVDKSVPGAINLDGDLTEDIWQTRQKLTKIISGEKATLDADFGVTWDNSNMYIGLKVLGADAAKTSFDKDSISFYLSPKNYKGNPYSKDDFQVQIFDKGARVIPGAAGVGKNDTLKVSDINVKYKAIANGYTMEIAMPWSVVGLIPQNIYQMGFDLMAFDGNDKGSIMEWSGGSWIDTTKNGTLTFTGDGSEAHNQSVTMSQPVFEAETPIVLDYAGAADKDWIGIYTKGTVPSEQNKPIISRPTAKFGQPKGQMSFKPADFILSDYNDVLPQGEYEAIMCKGDSYTVLTKESFKVGKIKIQTNKKLYLEANKEDITLTYKDAASDSWIGIYKADEVPGNGVPAIVWKGSSGNGSYTFTKSDFIASTHGDYTGKGIDHLMAGSYKAILFVDGNYTVEQAYPFTVKAPELPQISLQSTNYDLNFNITLNYKNTTSEKDWVGIYKKGTTPSGDNNGAAYAFKYATGGKGSLTFTQQDVIDYKYGPEASRGKPLPVGEYEFILLANDGYSILGRTGFTLSNQNTSSAPASVSYDRSAARLGYADGTVTINAAPNSNATGYALYWGDAEGKLAGYAPIAVVTKNGDATTYKMIKNTYIPTEATVLLAFGRAGTAESKEFASYQIPKDAKFTTGTPKVKFQAISDIHVTAWEPSFRNDNFGLALEDIKKTAPNSNGVFAIGDVVDQSTDNTYDKFLEIFNAHKNGLPEFNFSVGNHEYFETVSSPYAPENNKFTCKEKAQKFLDKMSTIGNAPSMYYDKYINGQHFIVMGSEQTELKDDFASISDTQFEWLKNKLAETKDKNEPIFLFLHQSMKNTVSGTTNGQEWWGLYPEQEAKLRKILKDYPQTIMFDGHTHWTLDDPYAMYDGKDKELSIFNTAGVGQLWSDAGSTIDGSQGYFVEVYNDKVLVRGRDLKAGQWLPNASFVVDLAEKFPGAFTADRTALNNAIQKAEALMHSNYTASSLAVLKNAVDAANKLPVTATQTEVDSALAAINSAINGLESSSHSSGKSHSHSSNNSNSTPETKPGLVPAKSFKLDTTHTYTFGAGGTYCFLVKTDSQSMPTVTSSSASVTATFFQKVDGGYLFKINGVSDGMATITAQIGNEVASFPVVVKTSSVKCDTTLPMRVKAGSEYCFKMSVTDGSSAMPSFTVGNGGAFKTQFVKKIGNDYFFKIQGVGKVGSSTGVYTTMPGKTPVLHCTVSIA